MAPTVPPVRPAERDLLGRPPYCRIGGARVRDGTLGADARLRADRRLDSSSERRGSVLCRTIPHGITRAACLHDPGGGRSTRHRPGDIDLLLVDVVMPLMDGRELARRMLSLRPKIKVMLMSGYEVSGLAEAGWPFIAKPLGIEELLQKVADTLRDDRPPPSLPHRRR